MIKFLTAGRALTSLYNNTRGHGYLYSYLMVEKHLYKNHIQACKDDVVDYPKSFMYWVRGTNREYRYYMNKNERV